MLLSVLPFAIGAAAAVVFTDDAALLGPSYVANYDPSNATAISLARAAFPGLIDELLDDGTILSDGLAFSIDVFSASTNNSLYTYSHVPDDMQDALSAGVLNDRTISKIGSVSKLFTIYALIAKGGIEIFSHPITKYIPELSRNGSVVNPLKQIAFDEITVGALASHQAGTGGAEDILAMNLANPEEVTLEQTIQYMLNLKPPVFAPYENSIYSDGGYVLLTAILESLTGMTYREAIKEIISEPLGLDDTSLLAPTGRDVNGLNYSLVAPDASAWGMDIPIVAGSGGIYSSHADLRTLALSILNSEILSPFVTRQWMKPLSGTGTLLEMVGAPWEIARLPISTGPGSDRVRVSDLYTKAGGVKGYGALLAISPDHGIGFSLLTVGEGAGTARFALRDLLGSNFIPAAEHAAVENAARNIAGTFVGENGALDANLTLSIDEDGAGLVLENLYIKETDSKHVIAALTEPTDLTVRVYPTGVNSAPASLSALYKPGFTGFVSHRAVSFGVPSTPRAALEGGQGMFDNTRSWSSIDYVGPVDQIILGFVGGRVTSVSALGSVFTRAPE